ncbi:uncharacterized protein LOC103509699 [Diaphorina citri]|uniref:Uncharacterized protein LOC103509699 n=1 Tax=Diaphorina citri TaxID=121845 RepID=A0A3Q0IU69_DIACI|nr:uncharacterized protein LOC103509699 [Diaphorina citri]
MPCKYQAVDSMPAREDEMSVVTVPSYKKILMPEIKTSNRKEDIRSQILKAYLSVVKITHCLERSHYRPIIFLKYTAQLLSLRPKDKLPGNQYSANERLIYSSICHLLYPDLISKLDALLPSLRKHHAKLENLQYIKLGSDTQEANPYLAVPEILQRKRRIVYEHNKSVKEKRKQYVQLLRNINYKQVRVVSFANLIEKPA